MSENITSVSYKRIISMPVQNPEIACHRKWCGGKTIKIAGKKMSPLYIWMISVCYGFLQKRISRLNTKTGQIKVLLKL